MKWMESESRNNGSYTARLYFKPNRDPKSAVNIINNRVSLASPNLPDVVKNAGVSVKVESAASDRKKGDIALVDEKGHGWDALQKRAGAIVKQLSADGMLVKSAA